MGEENQQSRNEESSRKISDDMNKIGRQGAKKGAKLLDKAKKKGKKVLGAGLRSARNAGLIGGLGGFGVFAGIGFIALLIFVILPSSKIYSPRYQNNGTAYTTVVDHYVKGESEESAVYSRSMKRSARNSLLESIVTRDSRIKLSKENQAIENYHYYNASKSLFENKYYMPLKGVEVEDKQGAELLKELVKKNVLVNDSENNQLVFNEKYIGELEKVEEEHMKRDLVDEYGREAYFQLPEELLAMLNSSIYSKEIIYDKPFLKGVGVKCEKTEDNDLGRPVYRFRTDSLDAKNSNLQKNVGLGSVFIYKPTFEVKTSASSSQQETGAGATGGINDLVYMGDSLFVGLQGATGIHSDNVVATIGHSLIQGKQISLPKVIEKKPKMLIMDYGTNDVEDGLEKYKKRYKDLINEIKKELPSTKIYLTKIYNPYTPKIFNDAIDEIAKETGATVIDSSNVFKNKPEYQSGDNLHYTTSGYKAWGEDINKQIFGESGTDSEKEEEKEEEEEEEVKEIELKDISDINIKYILDSVITFAGVYKFEYDVEVEVVDGEVVSQKEVPTGVVRESVDSSYIRNYLSNLKVEIPKSVYKNFNIRKLIDAFKGVKGSMSSSDGSEEGEGGSEGSALEGVEKWREIVERVSERWGIDPGLLLALMHNESGGNPHTKNGSYEGLFCFGPYDDEVAYYVKGDPVYGNYTSKNRRPSCPTKGPHNEAEHLKIGEFNIELMARRFSATMGLYLKRVKGIDYENVDVSPQDLQEAILFACAAHQTGEYGQLVAVDHHGPSTLYGNKGETYYKLYEQYIEDGGQWMYSKTPAVKKIMKQYRFQEISNRNYMSKTYKHYPLYNDGLQLDKITEDPEKLALFDPKKWMKHKAAGGSAGEGGSASESITSGTDGVSIDTVKVKEYDKFEEGGTDGEKGKSTIVRSLSPSEVDLILDQAVGMMEEEVYLAVKSSRGAFWRNGYEDEYFSEGIPNKPPPGYNMESGIWKEKIAESSFTGDVESILELAKLYGEGMHKVINRLVSQIGLPYKKGSHNINGFDMEGLIWYGFNYGEEKSLFKYASISDYGDEFKNVVEEGDIRPGDITFFKEPGSDEDVVTDAVIYIGNDACLYVSEEYKAVSIIRYSEFIEEVEKREVVDTRRVLKFTKGIAGEFDENKSALTGMPAGFVEGDYMFPLLVDDYSKVMLTDGVGVRLKHPKSGKPNIPHFGVDYGGLPIGTPVVATKSGKVIMSTEDLGGGGGVAIRLDHLDGTTSAYLHLLEGSRKVQVGDPVEQGQIIGQLGNSGIGTGEHLHFEIAVGLPNHRHGAKRDMMKFVPVQDMFKDLGITDARDKPLETIYPGNPAHWQNKNY